jgi:hypothetical protein
MLLKCNKVQKLEANLPTGAPRAKIVIGNARQYLLREGKA